MFGALKWISTTAIFLVVQVNECTRRNVWKNTTKYENTCLTIVMIIELNQKSADKYLITKL